jgi:polar amino acid transport system ATP-binding protein/sulfate transport system ATP-binding protein
MGFNDLANQALEGSDPAHETRHSRVGQYSLGEVLVRTTDVTLSFQNKDNPDDPPKIVLKPTSIEVRDIVRPGLAQGQVIGLLGPSGIGKSQFSRILAGLQKPTSGQVLVSDFEADKTGATLRPVEAGHVGMVAQDYPLFRWRTVLGNLIVALEHTTLSRKDKVARAAEYLQLFDVSELAEKYPAQLSGGQRQRIAIIRQLLCAEHFIVMDEPFTGLDPISKEVVCEVINKVATLHEHNTIFVVAHDITALCQISDQLWLFGRDRDDDGKVIPGATVKTKFDLIERGLAWQPGIYETQPFTDFVREVRQEFRHL